MILKSSAWRERMFAARAGAPAEGGSAAFFGTLGRRLGKTVEIVGGMGMMGGGSGALNQLLVLMDGIDEPPMMRRMLTNRTNTLLDALYIVPRRIGKVSLRVSRAQVAANNIYFIGACNVSLDVLDPALTRPGRLGRHIRFRTPIKHDRLDIFDHYLAKVKHDPALDTPKARDELARITNGYSPAMIEQVCSMALTYAHHEERTEFTRDDIVEAMTTIESGSAINIDYVDKRDARRRDPRGRPRDREPHLRRGHRVDPALDPHAGWLARPPPGDREGGAVLEVPLRGDRRADLDHGRDRRRAGLLRRELARRRRRHAGRHVDRRADGRRLGDGPAADRVRTRLLPHEQGRGRGAREGPEAAASGSASA